MNKMQFKIIDNPNITSHKRFFKYTKKALNILCHPCESRAFIGEMVATKFASPPAGKLIKY